MEKGNTPQEEGEVLVDPGPAPGGADVNPPPASPTRAGPSTVARATTPRKPWDSDVHHPDGSRTRYGRDADGKAYTEEFDADGNSQGRSYQRDGWTGGSSLNPDGSGTDSYRHTSGASEVTTYGKDGVWEGTDGSGPDGTWTDRPTDSGGSVTEWDDADGSSGREEFDASGNRIGGNASYENGTGWQGSTDDQGVYHEEGRQSGWFGQNDYSRTVRPDGSYETAYEYDDGSSAGMEVNADSSGRETKTGDDGSTMERTWTERGDQHWGGETVYRNPEGEVVDRPWNW